MKRRQALQLAAIGAVASAGVTQVAIAGPGHDKKPANVKKEQIDWGIAGDAKNAKRTVVVKMTDDMRFTPNKMDAKLGETVRFQAVNDGKIMHEFVIGTKKNNTEHAEMMMKFPKMEHDEPYMAHVKPGTKGEIIWMFNRAGTFEVACLVAGHYQAGMVPTLIVQA